jgi:gamma-glutamylcyclotransferase (GGCT)/AIG2-like uncharacterized protein YtfP
MKVFVYGTLKKGYHNHYLLKDAKYLGKNLTLPSFTMLNLGAFPGVVFGGNTPIHGEVYEVDEATFARLDRLEGYPNFYNRTEIITQYGSAWMYHLNREEYHVGAVLSGDWK